MPGWICPKCLKEAGDDPMSTAKGMYQYCIDNKFWYGFNEKWGIKYFGVLNTFIG